MQTLRSKIFKEIKFWGSTFVDKELTLFAASLSFYTIFTIIPLLLIMLTLLTSLPSFSLYYESVKAFLLSNLLPLNSEAMMGYIDSFLANSAKMGVIGVVSIFLSSLLFFKNFEYIANKIFHSQPRSLWDSITTYWTLLTLTPIALGVSFYITGYIASLMAAHTLTQSLNLLALLPSLIIWGLFFLIFLIAANTKIEPKAALLSSFVVALVFSLSKNAFIYYIFYNKSYTTIYGSFSVLMFLFLWIYLSWVIFIYGLKLCYIVDKIYKNSKRIEK